MKKYLILILLCAPIFSNAQSDTTCPIKILKYKLSQDDIQDNQINLVYQNISKKDIDALTFTVRCFNNFNEPVNAGMSGNEFTGISQSVLKAGKKVKDTWTMYLYDNTTKVDLPVITKVHFTDGTTWEN